MEEQVDDSYLCLLDNSSEQFEYDQTLMSDDKYAEELQFQEAIRASIIASNISQNGSAPKKSKKNGASTSHNGSAPKTSKKNGARTFHNGSAPKKSKKIGESSQSLCEICAERKDYDQMFPIQNCSHQYCILCITKYIATRLDKSQIVNRENAHVLACPGLDCIGILEIDKCRKNVSQSVIAMWDTVVCESMIDSSRKCYCPYKDCSLLLINDGEQEIREAECPFCRRLFCVQCNVPWHSGVGCEEYKRLNENERGKEDLMLHELAKQKKWPRCPRCKFFVEKIDGCLHMTCWCGYHFCYSCGGTWTSTHGGCQ